MNQVAACKGSFKQATAKTQGLSPANVEALNAVLNGGVQRAFL